MLCFFFVITLCRYNWNTDPELAPIAAMKHVDTDDFLHQAAHSMEDTFLRCSFEHYTVNCTDMLIVVPTDQGQMLPHNKYIMF